MTSGPISDAVTVYVNVPRSEFPQVRLLGARALEFPIVVETFKASFRELIARNEIGPEDFRADFMDLWRRFEADTETMNSIMQTLMPILSQVKVLDPTGRKEPIQ